LWKRFGSRIRVTFGGENGSNNSAMTSKKEMKTITINFRLKLVETMQGQVRLSLGPFERKLSQ